MLQRKSHDKNKKKAHYVEKLFKLLLLAIVTLKVLNHFKFNGLTKITKGVELFVLVVWALLTLKDKDSQVLMKKMLISSINPF
jgi:hypothetical protein